MATTVGTIARRTPLTGTNNPAYQVSKTVANDSLVVASAAADGAVMVRDSANADGWGFAPVLPAANVDLSGVVPVTRTINGQDLSADLTLTAGAGSLTGATLAANVLASSLTSLGTIAAMKATTVLSGGATTQLGVITIGTGNNNASVDASVILSRVVDNAVAGNAHGFTDTSVVTRAGGIGYNSFDSRPNISGTFGHYSGYQARPVYLGAGTTDAVYGFRSDLEVNHASAVVTTWSPIYIGQASGVGTVGSIRAIDIEDLSKGTSNYAIISHGNGRVQIADLTEATTSGIGSVMFAGGLYVAKKIVTPSSLTLGGRVIFGATGALGSIGAASDGVFSLLDNAGTSFGRLQFGGTTVAFPAWKRTGTTLEARFADDSGYTGVRGSTFNASSGLLMSGVVVVSAGVPSVTSAGTSPSVVGNSTAAFRVNVGTGGTATTIVLAMPLATTAWNANCQNLTANAANRADQRVVQLSSTTISVTVQNQTISTGAALAFAASDIVQFSCFAY